MASLVLTFLTLVAAAAPEEDHPSAAEEGQKIIEAMLVVGLIFIAVIAVGQFSKWVSHRREARRPRAY